MEEKVWRTSTWTEDIINKIIEQANSGNLIAAGKGIIRHQWGAYY